MEEINKMLLQLLAAIATGQENSCGDKEQHKTENRAKQHASRLNSRGRQNHKVEAYPCPWCFFWHVGREYRTDRLSYLAMRVRHEQFMRREKGEDDEA